MTNLTNLANHIVSSLVDSKESVKIEAVDNNHSATVRITVAPEDMGKIIGKKGAIANAIRTVMKAHGARNHKKVYIEIDD